MGYLSDWYESMVPCRKYEADLKGGLSESGKEADC